MNSSKNPLDTFKRLCPEAKTPAMCWAPGRVNLIGEHLDYNGLPVLPMTLDRSIRVAFAPMDDGLIRLYAADAAFPPTAFKNAAKLSPSPMGSWENYVKAAIQGMNDRFSPARLPGLAMLVEGDIPLGAGLSSSSALVVASSLAYLAALGIELEKDISRSELASLLAGAEHYVGTQGGGMDQAIILLGDAGHACKVDFFPLRAERAPLFDDHVFVVCNSLVKARKTGEALHHYNEGPLSCRMIRALLEKRAREEFGPEINIERIGDLWLGPLCLTDTEVDALQSEALPEERMTLALVALRLGITPDEVRDRWIGDMAEPEGGWRLKSRMRHQMTEYNRVERARDMLFLGDAVAFGELMNASHESCARDYAISCPELDALTRCALGGGALGARLTGAGFGGCTVNLVPRDGVESFMAHVGREYYAKRFPGDSRAEGAMLAAHAAPCAGYVIDA